MSESTSWTAERARVASLTRSREPDDPELIEARRNLRAVRLAEHVRKVVAEAPPLSNEQREVIAALLVSAKRPQAAHADLGLVDTHVEVGGDVG